MVTYRRPEWVAVSLDAVQRQSRRLDEVVVVDNDPECSAREPALRAGATYVAAGENRGMAGGLAVGLDAVAGRHRLLVVLDDDDPLPGRDVVENLVVFFDEVATSDLRCAAVGGAGALFDARRGRSRRPDMDQPVRALAVDWIGSGTMVVYDVDALVSIGGFDDGLFWAFEDLDVGLRLKAAGYSLYRDRDFATTAPFDHPPKPVATSTSAARRYYGTRNLVAIVRREAGTARSAVVAARALTGAVARPQGRRRQAVAATLTGVLDAYRGHVGRRDDVGRP